MVLGKAVAGRNAMRLCPGGVVIVTWTNESAAKQVGGKALSKVRAEGKTVRRSGGRGLNKSEAEGKAVKRSGGEVRGGNGGHEWPRELG